MATAFQVLQKSLLDARKDLESTNESIKKLTGYEQKFKVAPRPSPSGPDGRRRLSSTDSRPDRRLASNLRAWSESDNRKRDRPTEGRARLIGRLGSSGDVDLSDSKRRDPFGAKSRLAGRLGPPVNWEERKKDGGRDLDSDGDEDGEIIDQEARKPVQSSVVAVPAPPRPKADPKENEKSKKRNQRMFGFLQNTLRKFKDNEATAKTTEKERRRSEIEDKVTKTEELEKETAQMERKELFDQQKAQKTKVSTIARQMEMVNDYTVWNDHDKKMLGYIETKAKPVIFYLPKEHTLQTEELLAKTRDKIEGKINERLKEIESFIETANSLRADVFQSEGDVGGEGVGGNGKESKAINGEVPGAEQ